MDWVAEPVQTELANSITPVLMVPTETNVPGLRRHWDQGRLERAVQKLWHLCHSPMD